MKNTLLEEINKKVLKKICLKDTEYIIPKEVYDYIVELEYEKRN